MSKSILVVGCGSIGERHLRCLLKTSRAQVTPCETNGALLEKISQNYQVAGFNNSDKALAAKKFDGAVICTPAQTHIPIALKAIRAGVGALIKKPLSIGLEQIEELKREIAERKIFVSVAYVYHFMPAVRQAREFLQSGDLGRALQVSVVSGQHFPTFRPAYRDIYYSRHDMGGGAIQDALTHLINAVEWMVGPTSRIACEAKHQALEGVTVEDTVSAAARNKDVLVSYSMNQFQAPDEISFQIHCEHGSIKIELHEQRWGIFPRGASAWDYHSAPLVQRDDLFIAQSDAFLDGLEGKPTALCTVEEAIQTLKANLAALESARTAQTILIA